MTSVDEPARPNGRIRDAARTRAEILDVATQEFAAHGYAGARVDEIAARTRTTKRMIYYYFGGKEQLFTAVLERAYARDPRGRAGARRRAPGPGRGDPPAGRADLRPPRGAPRLHPPGQHREHPRGRAHAASEELGTIGSPALDVIRRILDAGPESGAVHGRRRRRRPAHDDQLVLLLPGRQPAHVRRPVRPRPGRPRPARALPHDARRHGRSPT